MIRVLVVDDQNLIRQAIKMYLEAESDIKVVGHANDGMEAVEQIQNLRPDVILLDIEMPGMDGITTIKIVNERFPQNKILVLSSYDNEENVNQAIQAGAKGYLLKNTPAHELISAIRFVLKGYCQLSPGLIEKFITRTTQPLPNNLSQIEDKFNQRLENLEKVVRSVNEETREEIYTELKLTKTQLFKTRAAYKTLEQKLSWLLLYLISLTIICFTGAIMFVFTKF